MSWISRMWGRAGLFFEAFHGRPMREAAGTTEPHPTRPAPLLLGLALAVMVALPGAAWAGGFEMVDYDLSKPTWTVALDDQGAATGAFALYVPARATVGGHVFLNFVGGVGGAYDTDIDATRMLGGVGVASPKGLVAALATNRGVFVTFDAAQAWALMGGVGRAMAGGQ